MPKCMLNAVKDKHLKEIVDGMNANFKKAEELIKAVIADLSDTIKHKDGEDISLYNPIAIDGAIRNLIIARSEMAIGRHIDG